MLTTTPYTADFQLIQSAVDNLFHNEAKYTLNDSVGSFFYDAWAIKPEFRGTAWEELLNTLPFSIGEARVIKLEPTHCYQTHSDIDDRYHLTLMGEHSYLINLDHKQMHLLKTDGVWYKMDAGLSHTAANFGRTTRMQLVVRELLTNSKLTDPVNVKLTATVPHSRFEFDQCVSPWLNFANKKNVLSNFTVASDYVTFSTERCVLPSLTKLLTNTFIMVTE